MLISGTKNGYKLELELPRVTNLVKYFDEEGKAFLKNWEKDPNNRDMRDRICQEGKVIHSLLESPNLVDFEGYSERIIKCFSDHSKLLNQLDVCLQEIPLFHLFPPTKFVGFAGTMDSIAKFEARKVFTEDFIVRLGLPDECINVIDWKNPSTLRTYHNYNLGYYLQLAAYTTAYTHMFYQSPEYLGDITGAILSMSSGDSYQMFYLSPDTLRWYGKQFRDIVFAYSLNKTFDWKNFVCMSNDHKATLVKPSELVCLGNM